MLMMIMCPVWQDREDAMLRDTDSASHPHHYLHLTRILTLYLLFAHILFACCFLEATNWPTVYRKGTIVG